MESNIIQRNDAINKFIVIFHALSPPRVYQISQLSISSGEKLSAEISFEWFELEIVDDKES